MEKCLFSTKDLLTKGLVQNWHSNAGHGIGRTPVCVSAIVPLEYTGAGH